MHMIWCKKKKKIIFLIVYDNFVGYRSKNSISTCMGGKGGIDLAIDWFQNNDSDIGIIVTDRHLQI